MGLKVAWLDASAVVFAPFAGVLLWALALRHFETEPDAARMRTALDVAPILAWAKRLREPGAVGQDAARRAVLELGAVAVAVWALLEAPHGWVWPACVLGWLLLAASVIDMRERILPDEINAAIAALGIVAAIAVGQDAVTGAVMGAVVDRAIGAAVGLLVFAGFAIAYEKLRGRPGLGLGDAKLLGALGAWVGWQGLASVVVIAAGAALGTLLVGALLRRRVPQAADETRFGPFLALGGWLTWLYGPLGFTGLSG